MPSGQANIGRTRQGVFSSRWDNWYHWSCEPLLGFFVLLPGDDGDVTSFHACGWRNQQPGIECNTLPECRGRHVLAIGRPVPVKLLHEGLQFRLLFVAPMILLK